ncbi:MAG: ABC transporter permease [Candidatus Margulisiibacteriota bacterium]
MPKKELTIIKPQHGWLMVDPRELWRFRETLYYFVWRDIKVRYKQTVLGFAWAILQPLLMMLIFSIFLGRIVRMSSHGIPYPVFSYAGLLPWTFFSNGVNQATSSLVSSANLINKVYFPRLLIPVAAIISGVIDFLLAFTVLLGMMVVYRIPLTGDIVWLPFFLLLAVVTSVGIGLWLTALNIMFRDVRYIVPFLLQLGMFATPVIYPSSLLPRSLRWLLGFNPMAGVVEGFRWSLLGIKYVPGPLIWISVLISLVILVTGVFFFRRMEKFFADVA